LAKWNEERRVAMGSIWRDFRAAEVDPVVALRQE
jgi:hypothetical protein